MDELILVSLKGEATLAEERELLRWRRESDENERYYQEFVRTWKLAEGGDELLFPRPAPAAADLIRIADEEGEATSSTSRRARNLVHGWGMRVAAAAAMVLIGFFAADFRTDEPPLDLGYGADEFVTGAGETATVSLRDGTVVRLAPESRLRLTGDMREREVHLAGRAYFAVAKREGKPFRVRSAAGEVTVLGTRFDLQTEREDLRLVVVEGRVAVAARGHETEVGAGEMSRVVEGTLLPVSQVPDVHTQIDWLGRFLAFQATPLADVAREIELQYGVRVEITDPELAERTITTWLSDRSLEDVLRIVCAVALAECSADDGVVTIQPQQ